MTPLNKVRLARWYRLVSSMETTYDKYCGGLTPFRSTLGWVETFTDISAGWKQPGWKRLIKLGVQAGTPYTREILRIDEDEHSSWAYQTYAPQGWTSCGAESPPKTRNDSYSGSAYQGMPNHLLDQTSRANSQALFRLRDAVRQENEHFNALISLAEGRQAVQGLARPYQQVQDLIVSHLDTTEKVLMRLRGKKYPSRKRPNERVEWRLLERKEKDAHIRKVIADSWLETTFGLIPTLSDFRSAVETIARWNSDADSRRRAVKGFGQCVSTLTNNTVGGSKGNHFLYKVSDQTVTTDTVVYRAGLAVSVAMDYDLNRLRELSGVTIENFVPTIYEVIPFSWLVDYFTTVGAALNANAVCTENVKWLIKSTVRKTKRTVVESFDTAGAARNAGSSIFNPANQFSITQATSGRNVASRTNVAREIKAGGDFVPPVMPRIKSLSELNPLQVSNILALVQSKVSRVGKSVRILRG